MAICHMVYTNAPDFYAHRVYDFVRYKQSSLWLKGQVFPLQWKDMQL